MTQLFERNHFLASLTTDLESATAGTGRAVLVCGEAGIGKTTLLEHFVKSHADKRCLWGACEALFTPHPLGPLHDIARMASGRLKTLLEEGMSRAVLFAAVLDELIAPSSPVLMVICARCERWITISPPSSPSSRPHRAPRQLPLPGV